MNIVFAGFGGQGVLTAGLIVANIAMDMGKEVLWMPAYGGQMRGGKSYSLVKIDDSPICHPDLEDLDVLVAMNKPSLLEFSKYVKEDGIILINSDTISDEDISVKNIKTIRAHFSEIASQVNNPRGANIAALGLMLKCTDLFPYDKFEKGLLKYFKEKGKEKYADINSAALKAGYLYDLK